MTVDCREMYKKYNYIKNILRQICEVINELFC